MQCWHVAARRPVCARPTPPGCPENTSNSGHGGLLRGRISLKTPAVRTSHTRTGILRGISHKQRNARTQQDPHRRKNNVLGVECGPDAACRCVGVAEAGVATTEACDGQPEAKAPIGPKRTVVVGGGPAGLATAIMLAQRGWSNIEESCASLKLTGRVHVNITIKHGDCVFSSSAMVPDGEWARDWLEVWERKQPPPPPEAVVEWGDVARSYNIGLANRGQDVLADIGALDLVASWSADVNGRKDWVPDGPEEGRVTEAVHRDYIVRVLPRDRLSTCLLQHCLENHSDAVTVRFGVECTSVKWTGNTVQLGCKDGEQPETEVEADFLVGADGARSAVHHAMEAEDSGFSIRRLHERNTRVYRTLRLEIPEDWRGDLNYSVRTAAGHVMEMLPTRERVLLGVLLFRPGDETVEGIRTEAEARNYFKENFPQLYPHIADTEFAAFASRRVSMLPTFQYAGPVLHRGDNTVVLGDSIHTVKPYFGMGVNSALEDVGVLSSSIQEHGDDNLGSALEAYSDRRSRDAKALVELSHGFDGGLAQFVIPLIIDKFFNKLAPWLFKPPAIRMLQSSVFGSFHQVRMRKRLDRILQVLFVAIAATLAVLAVKALVTAAASVLL